MDMSDKFTISVIIPCFNSRSTLEKCVESVLKQTRLPEEIIIVDDASTDGSFDYFRHLYRNQNLVYFFQNPKNIGPGGSRNIGLEIAGGTLVSFLDSDDQWQPKKLELQEAVFEQDFSISLCGHDRFSQEENFGKFGDVQNVRLKDLLLRNFIGCSSIMIRRSNIRFPEKYYAEDYRFILEHLIDGQKKVTFLKNGLYISLQTGLSNHSRQMWGGVSECYSYLYEKNKISFTQLIVLKIILSMKQIIKWLCR